MIEPNAPICEAAAFWVVRLHSDQRTRADEAAFRAWLEQDPARADAYADCAALWDGVAHAAETTDGRDALRTLRLPPRAPLRFSRRTALWAGGGAAAAAAVAVLAGPVALHAEQSFKTKPGEQRRLRLADGSGVLLNTDSQLRVRFIASERRLYLDRGQAFFQVAKDQNRPFRVFVGRDEIRALGTAFEVRRIGDSALVTLEEGRVAVYRADGLEASQRLHSSASLQAMEGVAAGPPVAVLRPGDQVDLAAAKPVEVRQVDLRKVQAWRYGRMILDDAPLGDTVADLNRYGGIQIVLADPKLANIRVSGVFHTGRPDDFVESVIAAFPVQIARQDENTIVLQPH